MAAPLPPPLFPAESLCAGTLLLALVTAAWLGISARKEGGADANWHGLTFLVGLALSLFVGAVFQTPARALPPLAGLWTGLATAWYWLPRSAHAPVASAGALACGITALAGIGLVWQGVPAANAAIGWMAGAASVGLLRHVHPPNRQLDGVWALFACASGLAAWCDKLFPQTPIGWALAAGLALLPLALWLRPTPVTWGTATGLVAAWILGAGWWLLGVFHLPVTWLGAAAVAGIATLAAAYRGRSERVFVLACLIGGGALLVVENRLAGIAGVALGGVALGVLWRSLDEASGSKLVLTWLLTVLASRTWLQLFFERVEFTHYGVDITHPYATAGLVLGALAPAALLWRPGTAHRITRLGLTLGVLGFPAAVGYLLHIEALAAAWMGLIAGGFVLTATGAAPVGERADAADAEGPTWMPGLLMAHGSVALLAAPWLVAALDATRFERVLVVLGLAFVTAVWLIFAVRESVVPPGSPDASAAS